MHSGTFTEHTHLSMHHKVIPSSGAAAASSATDLTLRQEPTRDDVIGAARNLQMGTQTHLGMHHKRIPSGSAAAASEAAAPAVVLGKRDDVIGAARNLQMGTQTHLGMHNVVIPSASSAKAVKAAPVQEEVKDLKQGHQEGGADSDGKNFADAGINHQVQVNP